MGRADLLLRVGLRRHRQFAVAPQRHAALVAVLAHLAGERLHRQFPPAMTGLDAKRLAGAVGQRGAVAVVAEGRVEAGVGILRVVLVEDRLRPGDLAEPGPGLAAELCGHRGPVAVDVAVGDQFPPLGLVGHHVPHRDVDGAVTAVLVLPERAGLRPPRLKVTGGQRVEVGVEVGDGRVEGRPHGGPLLRRERVVAPQAALFAGEVFPQDRAEALEPGVRGRVAAEHAYDAPVALEAVEDGREVLGADEGRAARQVAPLRAAVARLVAGAGDVDLNHAAAVRLAGATHARRNHAGQGLLLGHVGLPQSR